MRFGLPRLAEAPCWLLLASACNGPSSDDTPAVVPAPCETDLTWNNFAGPYFKTWCTACHSSTLPADRRGGAPIGVDFDTFARATPLLDRVAIRTYGSQGGMPPAGPTPTDDLTSLEEWITCGILDTETEPPQISDCGAPAEHVGDVAASAGTPCAGHDLSIQGELTVDGDTDLSCVCEVTGSLQILAGASNIALPQLRTVGGAVTTEPGASPATLDLPQLVTVGGDLRLDALGAVTTFDFADLVTVGGDFVVSGAGDLVTFSVPRLENIGGSLSVSSLPELVDIPNFTGVKGPIPGSVTLSDLPLYHGPIYGGWSALLRVESVGDSITIERTGLREIAGFQETTAVGGSVIIRENDVLESIVGFFELAEVGARIEIADNPSLVSFAPLPMLVSIGATADYPDAGLFLRNNAALTELDTFERLADLDAFDLINCDSLPMLAGFTDSQLRGLPGGLRIYGNEGLTTMFAFSRLTSTGVFEIRDNPALSVVVLPDLKKTDAFTVRSNRIVDFVGIEVLDVVDGDLAIQSNLSLASVEALATVQTVTGSVVVTDNLNLPTANAQAFADGIPSVGGSVVVVNNGP